jgi:hypothetical protein
MSLPHPTRKTIHALLIAMLGLWLTSTTASAHENLTGDERPAPTQPQTNHTPALGSEEQAPEPDTPSGKSGPRGFTPQSQPAFSRWLNEVRAQRRAQQAQRRAARQARHEAMNPLGAAQREQRQEQFQRHREEVREYMEQERRHYLNFGPWLTPMIPPPPPPGVPQSTGEPAEPPAATSPAPVPQDWDNRWYYNGW